MSAAVKFANFVGTWTFIAAQLLVLIAWIVWNTFALEHLRFDPYPFIFLNLALSFEAAFCAPILLMASNVSADQAQSCMDRDLLVDISTNDKIDEILRLIREGKDGA